MHKTKTGNKNNVKCHLWLVSSRTESELIQQTVMSAEVPVDPKQINYLTVAMMNRLWIPPTTTIVGLLDVGASHDNFQKLSKWIETQLTLSANAGAANELPKLQRPFRDAVNHYPEFQGSDMKLGTVSNLILLPRMLRDAPTYLGMDRKRLNAEVRPSLTEIPIGEQSIAFDRFELDA